MELQEVGFGGMDRIGLAQDKDRFLALVSAVTNLWISHNGGIYWLAEHLLASQEGPRCLQLITEWAISGNTQIFEKKELVSLWLSVRPYTWNNSASFGRI